MSALAKALADPWRLSVCSHGHTSIRTGERNDCPDADLIASVYDDEFAPMLLVAPDLLAALIEITKVADEPRKDWSRVVGDIARAAIAKATGAA